MNDVAVSRRRFLVLSGGLAAIGGCSPAPTPPVEVGSVGAGNVSSLPLGSLRVVASEPLCIGRDAGGIYAMTLTCTHAGCDMGVRGSVSPQGIVCDCHGSQFDANGNVVSGPAPAPLDHFAVTMDSAENLTVHSDQVVGSDQRLTVSG